MPGHEATGHGARRFAGPSPLCLSPGDLDRVLAAPHHRWQDRPPSVRPRLEQKLGQRAGKTRVVTTPCPAQACAGTSRHVTEASRLQTDLRRSHNGTKLLLWTERGAPKFMLQIELPG